MSGESEVLVSTHRVHLRNSSIAFSLELVPFGIYSKTSIHLMISFVRQRLALV